VADSLNVQDGDFIRDVRTVEKAENGHEWRSVKELISRKHPYQQEGIYELKD
jgi:hypothetical protein